MIVIAGTGSISEITCSAFFPLTASYLQTLAALTAILNAGSRYAGSKRYYYCDRVDMSP